ncbi:MAG TPA: GDP-mannose 4,6-dehydratase [Thermoleophilaceae bacterium]|nr:GDP-mannose 4,6-dehydratase [Thermoleophilaceae bacterium]
MDARPAAGRAAERLSRALVTGGGGFVGRHLVEHLRSRGDEVTAPPREVLELEDPHAVRGAVAALGPDAVYHLAAQASVPASWEDPRSTLSANLDTTLNVLEAVRHEAPGASVLLAGSGEVYGVPERLPVHESAPLRPQNPYAVSKAACDLLGGQYADAHGLRVVRTRAFNHAGPGQSDLYVVGALSRQVAEAETAGRSEAVIRTGNADSRRDFTDVRDVVRAYGRADSLEPGAYNVCSGRTASVRDLLALLDAATPLTLEHEIDPARVRAHDVPEIRGSAERLAGWAPEIPLQRTVADALEWWRRTL